MNFYPHATYVFFIFMKTIATLKFKLQKCMNNLTSLDMADYCIGKNFMVSH